MKRSKHISLVLSGALATGSWAGCSPDPVEAPSPATVVSPENTYTNNHHAGGSHGGYYHAPYRSWYPFPYNHYRAGQGYFHGGNWTPAPHQSPIAASKPTPAAAQHINTRATPASGSSAPGSSISRGGFGSGSHSSSSS